MVEHIGQESPYLKSFDDSVSIFEQISQELQTIAEADIDQLYYWDLVTSRKADSLQS